MHSTGSDPFFGCGVEADLRNSDIQILYLSEGGLGIGDRDYYLKESNAAIKEGYRNFLNRIFTLAGVDEAKEAADDALFGRSACGFAAPDGKGRLRRRRRKTVPHPE